MYFNNIPQGFGLAQQQQQDIDKPLLEPNAFGLNTAQNAPRVPSNAQNYAQKFGPNYQSPAFPSQQGSQGIGGLSQPAPQMQNFGGGTPFSMNRTLQPVTSAQKPIAGQAMAGGGVVKQTLGKSQVVSDGIAALRGQHPNPRGALDAYDREFGADATAELMRAYADGGVVSGPGSGVADLVPGSIDGREDVRIASGEYVIPAWAVATLGDGSTEAGAKILDAMVARLREEGSERIMGSEPINPSEFLPA